MYPTPFICKNNMLGDEMVHTYLGETINFHITYKRKIGAFLVDSYGNVEVQAPKGTPFEYLIQLLEVGLDSDNT